MDNKTYAESVLISAIESYMKGKKVYQCYRTQHSFIDIYLEDACEELGIPSNTALEFKTTLMFDTIFRCKIMHQKAAQFDGIDNFYLVYVSTQFSEEKIKQYETDKFKVISVKELLKRKRPRLKRTDWREERDYLVQKAKGSIIKNLVTLFLGAGVSIDAGLPDWEGLLRRLLLKYIQNDGKDIDYTCIDAKCFHSSVITARYIQEYIAKQVGEKFDFEDAISEALWSEYQPKGTKTIIGTIADIISVKKGLISSAITYNYDDLLETALGPDKAQTIGRASDIERGKFPIYHVHGILPHEKNKGETVLANAILSENQYHKLYEEAFHWSNVEQLHALQRNTCFFIGFSMADPNLRRLLDIAKSDGRHFVFLRRKEFSVCENQKNEENLQVHERLMNSLGLNVIWFEDFHELPKLLECIFLED